MQEIRPERALSTERSREEFVQSHLRRIYLQIYRMVGSADDAQEFVTKLDKAGVDSFRWTRNPAQIRIEKLKS